MKKMIFSMALLASFGAFAQQNDEPTTEGTWTRGGNVSLVFNQAAFNNDWTGGGTNNVALNLAVSYAFNYKKNDWTWDNNLYLDYGLTKLKGDEYTRKTTDRLEYNSLLGKQASNNWYYSAFLNFKTQFSKGYNYDKPERRLINEFFSPAYLQFGPGMLWKKNDNLKVNLAPATSKLVMVNKDFTKAGDYYGVKKGESLRYELGFAANGYAKFNLMENVSMENILNVYSNYLDKPQNLDIDYTANVVMGINKYLSANFTFQAIYDDNAVGAFQIRELFGAGLNYKF
ncbi:DUF3078 domain-containing protein [Capnocytophaga canimorsus]|uniref:DUF3078 domain-containing protein n=1 Tax=Capnocytophaga canimorsus TaxID=28188 RepID=A0A0B7IJV3_9FLAO|nr:DUF3078 domain-containing protein [Capnocytophaga canimorsus]CEN50233.1 conserved exported hypothetical protein [Capnocytophaga canimorsus]